MAGLVISDTNFFNRLRPSNLSSTRQKIFVLFLFLLITLGTVGVTLYRIANAVVPPLVLGQMSYQKYDRHALTDKAGMQINVANGNLVIDTQEFNVKGTGPSLNIARYYNTRATGSGQLGDRWTLSVGKDISITSNGNGSGGYTTPSEYTAAKLATVAGGGWKLTYSQTGDVYTFNTAGKQISEADADGLTITYAYNGNGTLASATDTQGRVTTFTNYSGTNVGKITDSTGRFVTYGYTSGKLTSVTDVSGNTWGYTYDAGTGNMYEITDPRGFVTRLDYDGTNRVESIESNLNVVGTDGTWWYNFDNTNSQSTVTDPEGHVTTYTYDASGRITTTLNAVGSTNGETWDANNNRTATLDPSNYATTFTFDSNNNLSAAQNPSLAGGAPGAKTQYAYTDAAHPYLPSSKTDASGNITSYSYTTNGNLSSSSQTGGSGAVATTYKRQGDPISGGGTVNCSAKPGQVCSAIDGNSNTTTYTYDSLGNVLTIVKPGPVGITTLTYDTLSRVKTSTDGNGSKVTVIYDNMDRPTKLTYATGGSVINYVYDKHGNMTQRDDAAGQTNWTYDGLNRVTKIQQTGKADINYTYDLAGNLKTEQGAGGTTSYYYDDADQIEHINQSVGGVGSNTFFEFTDGRPTKVTMPGNIVQTMTYDRAGRQTSIKAVKNGTTVLTDYTATYTSSTGSDTQLMQTEVDNLAAITNTYSYDTLNRLTGANGTGTGSNDYTYTYDNNGNRTGKSKTESRVLL